MVTLQDALAYFDLGLSIIPIKPGTKKARGRYKQYQRRRPDESRVRGWFGDDNQIALAAIMGEVSGGLVCRDFDKMSAYENWVAEHPELASTLPTVATPRDGGGRHVYCRGDIAQIREASGGAAIIDYGDGELRGGGYCLLPPSTHPDGSYRWLNPLPPTRLPLIDLREAGFIQCNREDGENGVDRENLGGLREPKTLSESIVAADVIKMAIVSALPTRVGQRHRMIFELARGLKAIPGLADAPLSDLKPYFRQWHRAAIKVIKTKAFEESWFDFAEAWGKVKFPKGQEPIRMLFNKAVAAELPQVAHEYETLEVRLLVALCRELQRAGGTAPFFLGCRTAGELLGVDHSVAWRWLKLLQHDKILDLVSTGSQANHQASRYRYLHTL